MAQRGNRGKARLLIRSIQGGKGQSRANLIFYFGISFDAVRARNNCKFPGSRSRSMSRTDSKRTDTSALDNPKRASVVCKMRRK